jgi:hypothetical protein
MPPAIEMENTLRNGVVIGKLAHFFAPRVVPLKQLYDVDLAVYNACMSTCWSVTDILAGEGPCVSSYGQHCTVAAGHGEHQDASGLL